MTQVAADPQTGDGTGGPEVSSQVSADPEQMYVVASGFRSVGTEAATSATTIANSLTSQVGTPQVGGSKALIARVQQAIESAIAFTSAAGNGVITIAGGIETAADNYVVDDVSAAQGQEQTQQAFPGTSTTGGSALDGGSGQPGGTGGGGQEAGAAEQGSGAAAQPFAPGNGAQQPHRYTADDIRKAISAMDPKLLTLVEMMLAYQAAEGETVSLSWDLNSDRFDVAAIMAALRGPSAATPWDAGAKSGAKDSAAPPDHTLPADEGVISFLSDPSDPSSIEYAYDEGDDATQGTLTVSNVADGDIATEHPTSLEDLQQAVADFAGEHGEHVTLTFGFEGGQMQTIQSPESTPKTTASAAGS